MCPPRETGYDQTAITITYHTTARPDLPTTTTGPLPDLATPDRRLLARQKTTVDWGSTLQVSTEIQNVGPGACRPVPGPFPPDRAGRLDERLDLPGRNVRSTASPPGRAGARRDSDACPTACPRACRSTASATDGSWLSSTPRTRSSTNREEQQRRDLRPDHLAAAGQRDDRADRRRSRRSALDPVRSRQASQNAAKVAAAARRAARLAGRGA